MIYRDFLFLWQPQKTQLCPNFAQRKVPPPQPVAHRLQWPAVTQSLPQAGEEDRLTVIPAGLGKEKSLPAISNRNKLNYASGEVRKKDDSSPLKVGRSKLVHGISSVLICSALWAGGSCDEPFLSHEPRKVLLSLSVMDISSVTTAPGGEKDRIAVHRGPKISIIFPFPPFSVHHPPLCCQRKEPLRGYPPPFLNSHDFAASDPSPPVFNRGYENQAACSLFVFSDLLCVLPAARAMAFPNPGHHRELWVHPGLTGEVQETAAKLSLCKN